MSLGEASGQEALFDEAGRFCAAVLPESSIYAFLHRERERLFPDGLFADLFARGGRRSVPPSVVATVMVLQRLEGLSDREAAERYAFDARFRYAAGVSGYGESVWESFSHTVLVDMRERLRQSDLPDRVFEVTLQAAKLAGLIGPRRVLDSTPLYDAVATMDTVTLLRSAIRGLLEAADSPWEERLRAVLSSGDDYASRAKPQIDWQDAKAREELIDSRARDAFACLELLDGESLSGELYEAMQLLATVSGQDLEKGDDGVLRIARRVGRDRVISTVDPDARHGHKSSSKGFDGYKGSVAVDPDSELITSTKVISGNAADASAMPDLIEDLRSEEGGETSKESESEEDREKPKVYGDTGYGSGEMQAELAAKGIESRCKTPKATNQGGRFSKDRFTVDLEQKTVTCPAGVTVGWWSDGKGNTARFGDHCQDCALREQCTDSKRGRTLWIGPYEEALSRARSEQAEADWQEDYKSTRPKVERKLANMVRRKHGGRRSRVRGQKKVDADFRLLGAAVNLARLAVLNLRWTLNGWTVCGN